MTKGQFTNAKSPIGTFRGSESKGGGITPIDNVSNGTDERNNYNDTMKQTYQVKTGTNFKKQPTVQKQVTTNTFVKGKISFRNNQEKKQGPVKT